MKFKKPVVMRLLLYYGSAAGVLALVAWRTGHNGDIVPLLFVTAILGVASYALGFALYLRRVDPERPVARSRRRRGHRDR
jgi:heme/copper-type cytochrome/quinol oxidase subunit 3